LRRPLTAAAVLGVLYVGLGAVLDGGAQRLFGNVTTAVAVLAVGVGVLLRAGRVAGAARRGWACIGASAVVWGLGQLVHSTYQFTTANGLVPGPADIGFLGAVPLLVAGTLLHPAVAASGLSLVRSVLDGVIVATALLLLMLVTTVGPFQDGGGSLSTALVTLAYPLADVLVVGTGLTALSRIRGGARTSVSLVLVALVCFVLADSAYAWGATAQTVETGWPYDAGWIVGFLLLGLASRAAGSDTLEDPSTTEAPAAAEGRANAVRRAVAVMPYLAVVVAMAAGGTQYFRGELEVGGQHSSTALVLIAAMILRQSVSVMDASAAVRELARGEAYFRSIVQGSSDVTTIVDENLLVVWQSPSARTVFGVNERVAVGRTLWKLVHRDDHGELDAAVRRAIDGSGSRPGMTSLRVRVRDGSGRWREVETSLANHLGTPAIRGIVLHSRDISERRSLEARLEEMAFTDALTGLPNRRRFLDRLEETRERLEASGEMFTVLAVDLDGFKAVNDLHGHAAGDALLTEVSARLRAEVRDVDTVARLGGDEFAVLFSGGAEEGRRLGERLVDTVAAPYTLGRITARVSVSVGVAEAAAGDDGAVVLRNADLALRRAKATGKKRVEGYVPALHQGVLDRLALEHDLAGALERGEIRLAYQPIFDLSRDIIVGAEALMRWRHPTRGEVSPAVFIPVAEESGQIVELGGWALHEACRQIAAWDAAGYQLQMGVNVSTRQFRTEAGQTLGEVVQSAVTATGLDPGRLVLEITESAFLDSFDTALAELGALQALGAHIALDDFGTGYSSLSYLRRLPVDILKIDREFVSGMSAEDQVAALAELVVRLGERLGIEVVAEGIESAAEVAGVLGIGCVLGQGYHLGRPSSPEELDAVLAVRTVSAVPGVTL
jgi:diguanylate cyclase (GGDEF)-like protein/PAS domain S-box-containing protein